MTSNYRDWAGVLNQLAGLSGNRTLDPCGAANVYAGLSGNGTLDLLGALNYKNGTYTPAVKRLDLNGVCNALAGTQNTPLEALAALNHLAGNSPS
jgi:hypothetical protein